MANPVKLALVGCGWISNAHVKAYKDLYDRGCREFEVVACCDPVTEAAQERAEAIAAFQGHRPELLSGVDALIEAGNAEAADVCLPHCYHHTAAVPLLAAGMHVLLEKPLGITIRASQKIIDAAKAHGRVLATAENTRRTLGSRACRWAIREAKKLGDVRAVDVAWIQHSPFDAKDPKFKWRLIKNLTGGGMIMDSGAHFADMMLHMFGEPESVYCTMATHDTLPIEDAPRVGDTVADVEDTWHALIRFASGVEVHWRYSRAFHGEPVRLANYYGTDGTLQDHSFPFHCFESGGSLTQPDGAVVDKEALQEEYMASLSAEEKNKTFPYGATDGFSVEIADFVRSLRNGKTPEIDGEGGMRAKALCEACYESAVAGAPVQYADVLNGTVSAYQDPINHFWEI